VNYSKNLLDKFKEILEKYSLLKKEERILLCVSGGVDSVVLFHLFNLIKEEFNLTFLVSHFDHRIRKDSLEDALFVKTLCERFAIPFIYSTVPVKEYARREKISLEVAGRNLRYSLWNRLVEKYALQKIALAHHLDDLIEEIFMRIIKGTGKRGLAGIPLKRENKIIRPLLFFTKTELLKFAMENKLSWREDLTNLDLRYFRNKIRHILIPFIEKHFGVSFKKNLQKTALILSEEEDFLEKLAEESFHRLNKGSENNPRFEVEEFRNLHPAFRRRIYFVTFKKLGLPLSRIGYTHVEKIDALLELKSGTSIDLPGGLIAGKSGRFIFFAGKEILEKGKEEIFVENQGKYEIFGRNLRIFKTRFLEIEEDFREGMIFSAKKLRFPFVLRGRKKGDRIWIAGVGYKKLKKFLQEKGVPFYNRENLILCEYRGEVVGICGLYIHPEYEPKHPAEEVIVIEIEN